MSVLANNTNSSVELIVEGIFDHRMKFISLLTLHIPSVLCFLFLLYHLLFNRILRRELHNHVMIVLLLSGLITVLIDVPMILNYLYTGVSTTTTSTGCLLWNFIDLSLYALISLYMFWASFERHILIFHERLINSRQRQYLIHYAPLIIIPSYVVLFYSGVIFMHPCQNAFDYSQVVCGVLCYYIDTPWLAVVDQLAHNMIPAILIALLNVFLLIRIIWQKRHHMQRRMNWRQQRKMVLQLVPVSILYVCGVTPYALLVCVHMLGGWDGVGMDLQAHFFYLFYLMTILLPFVCLMGMPNLYSKLSCKRRVQVAPNMNITHIHIRSRLRDVHTHL